MHVVLVGPDLEENLSLRYLASSLAAASHTVGLAAFDSPHDMDRVLDLAAGADLVGLSMCFQVRAREFLALARSLRQRRPELRLVAGGHYASCAAWELLEHHAELDAIVVHEGEQTMVELAGLPDPSPARLAGVPGLVFRAADGAIVATSPRPIVADLDTLPPPDRSGPARLLAGVPTSYMMGSRGCLGACDYCCITTLHRLAPGKRFRQRHPEAIADEMAGLYHQRGVRQFVFHDDNFLVPSEQRNLERVEALDVALRRRGLRHLGLVLKCRPADVTRPVLLRLREMGLLRVFLGIESGSCEGLASIGRRQTVEAAHQGLDLCAELGISSQYTIILFHPEATPATMLADLAFVRRHLGHPLSFCRAEIYAGTPLERRMLREGRAFGNYLARAYHYADPATARVWSLAQQVLAARCFGESNLMGQVIRLDHQMAVFRHFYDGRNVDDLLAEFSACELAANRDTLELLEEMIEIGVASVTAGGTAGNGASSDSPGADSPGADSPGADSPGADSPAPSERIAALRQHEQAQRQILEARLCELRGAVASQAFAMIGLSRPGTQRRPPAHNLLRALPRHAAAALLAVGLSGCGERQKPPADATAQRDRIYREDGGVIEAPPPPVDAGSPPDARPRPDVGVRPDGGDYREDGGVIEAPPPPVDGGEWREDAGIEEMAPPPLDAD